MICKIYPDCGHPDLKDPTHPVRYFDIRKLTETECLRLMDVPNWGIDMLTHPETNNGLTRSALYKLAGNSIVVSCLYHIFRNIWLTEDDPSEQQTLFPEPTFRLPFPKDGKIRMITLCSGYDSQALAMMQLCNAAREVHGISNAAYELVNWAEYDPETPNIPIESQPAVRAHNVLFPEWADRNLGDMTRIDWQAQMERYKAEGNDDIDVLFYSTPCFPAGVMITTSEGRKPIESLKKGDMVYTHLGNWKEIIDWGSKPYDGLIYTIGCTALRDRDGRQRIRCTANHPFWVRRYGKAKPTFIAASEILPGDMIARCSDPEKGNIEWREVKWLKRRSARKIAKDKNGILVYNIEVADDHTYLANNVFVHNCQSISQAGKREGMGKDSGTRSAVLWYTENAIDVLHPKILIQENVSAMANAKNIDDFKEWQQTCRKHGYTNYWKILNAKDYGVPQNRDRVFMVSVRNDLRLPTYRFPKPFPLSAKVGDILETTDNKKYFLTAENVIKYLAINEKPDEKGVIYATSDHFLSDMEIAEIRERNNDGQGATLLKLPKRTASTVPAFDFDTGEVITVTIDSQKAGESTEAVGVFDEVSPDIYDEEEETECGSDND